MNVDKYIITLRPKDVVLDTEVANQKMLVMPLDYREKFTEECLKENKRAKRRYIWSFTSLVIGVVLSMVSVVLSLTPGMTQWAILMLLAGFAITMVCLSTLITTRSKVVCIISPSEKLSLMLTKGDPFDSYACGEKHVDRVSMDIILVTNNGEIIMQAISGCFLFKREISCPILDLAEFEPVLYIPYGDLILCATEDEIGDAFVYLTNKNN